MGRSTENGGSKPCSSLPAVATILLLMLGACGGGGDAGQAPLAAADAPLAAAAKPAPAARASVAPRYDAELIPVPSEQIGVGRRSINAAGQVAGSYVTFDNRTRGFFFDGRLIDIGTLGGLQTMPSAINDAGQVVGASETTYRVARIPSIYNTWFSYQREAFIWNKDKGMRVIAPVPDDAWRNHPDSSSTATDINEAGQVIGRKRTILGDYYPPFVWTEKDGLRDLDEPLEEWDYASQLNDAGQFLAGGIGPSEDPRFPGRSVSRSILYSTATDTAIPLFNPNNAPSPDTTIVAFVAGGLNNQGVVAGSRTEFDRQTAVRSTRAIVLRPLENHVEERIGETIGMNVESHALDINEAGEVAIVTGTPDSESRKGYFWSKFGGLVDLGSLDGSYTEPVAINGDGIIVGRARRPDGSFAAFAWSSKTGLVALDSRLRGANSRLRLREAVAVTDSGLILAKTEKELVLLRPAAPQGGPRGRR